MDVSDGENWTYVGLKSCSLSRIERTSLRVLPSSKYSLVMRPRLLFHSSGL